MNSRLNTVWRALLLLFCGIVALWLVAPSLVVIPLSFTDRPTFTFPPTGWSTQWYANFFSDPSWMAALQASIQVGVLVAIVATVCGTAAALALSRTRFFGQQGLRALLLAPMLVPVIVIAIGLYALFLRLNLLGTTFGFVVAHSVLALPFVIIPVMASLQGFDRRLEDAAAICGAGRWTTFRTVTLPLVAPGVLSGAVFAFATSFDEVVLSLFIQSPYLQTLPVRMYSSVTRDTDPTIAAAATLILALTTVVTVLASLYATRRRNAG
ncbi:MULTISPECIES: ABC transporter permease [Mycolicibacterium]|uniref:ABC transporter permease n=1 Tax=Mycolicibacterium goodii TaxID=134601 RepID=A0ABS6HXE5_MYCGD|nr:MULTISPECIES: ABC transporter permease [Mycolicibacterium]MBU8819476.1 ABC transporter permease [Mycolicibacterium goodii]MBU8827341.1 ABC transporter permease [Mycolicibacterium goodii]MBU8833291.1 ABC transporter permease [Mycolicibacterium goodii]MBU8841042.1 ABC transporter permease [Mycolicibacterium goodii]PJK18378.1 ABC transporter permease [Mycolicibacterium goodii]